MKTLHPKVLLVVAVALMDGEGKVLLAQRPERKHMGGLWEFPGGKVEEGETPEQSLVREIREELCITLLEEDIKPLTFSSFSYEKFHLLMPLYTCKRWSGVITAREHKALRWVLMNELTDYPMPPADLPLISFLQKIFIG